MTIGKIKRVPLREVWKHEAHDFTTWLEQNVDVLNSALDLNLVNVDREKDAGDFSVDLVAEDEAGNLTVIENQLHKSNHDHLGKLITYLTMLEAKKAIWIVSEPRPEHVKAVAWLNESSSASFYLVKVEAIRIQNSSPAPLLTLITGPSAEAIEAGNKKKEIAENHLLRKRFWTELLEKAKRRTKLHAGLSPSEYNWIGTGAGIRGIYFNYSVRQHDGKAELYIDPDKETGEGNERFLDALLKQKNEIEKVFGGALEWERLEGRRACRVQKTISVGGWRDEDKWPAQQDKMVDAMTRLEKALQPHLKKLKG